MEVHNGCQLLGRRLQLSAFRGEHDRTRRGRGHRERRNERGRHGTASGFRIQLLQGSCEAPYRRSSPPSPDVPPGQSTRANPPKIFIIAGAGLQHTLRNLPSYESCPVNVHLLVRHPEGRYVEDGPQADSCRAAAAPPFHIDSELACQHDRKGVPALVEQQQLGPEQCSGGSYLPLRSHRRCGQERSRWDQRGRSGDVRPVPSSDTRSM
eukprot:scaffold1410_cov242-Pinguiococcus_pyrenoidosus.AAC.3